MHPFYEKKQDDFHFYHFDSLTFPEHFHHHIELIYVIEGSIEVTIMAKSKFLHQGDLGLILSNEIHSYYTADTSKAIGLLFDSSLCGSLKQLFEKQTIETPFLCKKIVPRDIPQALNTLNSLSYNKVNSNHLISAWIQVILANIIDYSILIKKENRNNNYLTFQLVEYMMEHFREPITLGSLANALHINKYYLSHIFSNQLQMSFPNYLAHLRTEHAIFLMKTTDLSLTTIWQESGFLSQRSFNRIFLQLQGINPLRFRQKINGDI